MGISILPVILLLTFFFLLVPAAGAFYVRSGWRQFRRQMIESSLHPFAGYRDIHNPGNGFIGSFRFLGTLDALEEHSVWLRNRRLTLKVDMTKCQVYLLPSQSEGESEGLYENNVEVIPDESPQKIAWRTIFSLPEGTKVFISGALFGEQGKAVFRATKDNPLLLVIYDGAEETILRRSIWGGRHKNEYWNQFTFPSLIVGFFSLLFYAYYQFRIGPFMRVPGLAALTAALVPIAGFLPPGIVGLYLFRNNWRRARILRAERDLLLLPLRYFDEDADIHRLEPVLLPDGTLYALQSISGGMDTLQRDCLPGMKVRMPGIHLPPEKTGPPGFFLFASPLPAGNSLCYMPPTDPMAEYICIPGDPRKLSSRCSAEARKFEYISAASISLGIGVNLLLIFIILNLLIR